MEQEQTPKDEGYKADGSMPNQPERDPKTGAPVEEPVAETKPVEDTGDVDPVNEDSTEDEERADADLNEEDLKEQEDKEDAAGEANTEAETEGGERNE